MAVAAKGVSALHDGAAVFLPVARRCPCASPVDPKCVPLVTSCLRRRWLCWSEIQKGDCLNRPLDHRDRQAIRCRQRLQIVATPLGRRTNHRMAQPQSSSCKRLRGNDCERRSVAYDRQRQVALAKTRQSMISAPKTLSVGLSAPS